ncbi:MAG: 16S rRNA (cytidine(1402)-2'-O)-methyltransferase [Candidatus Caenarcaniphilales bacterium]|nr:16S rRNA (cytidine(1402)-2'-O)-methyltransferase [Candidatus Caenarcaniphilales bacterium]
MLYIIASPIGNLGDISERARLTIERVDLVACEDTRETSKLLKHLSIKKPLLSCQAHDEDYKAQKIIAHLKEGKKVAYLSDAGTPGISDPGNLLVEAVVREGLPVQAIPGASALTTLLSICGFNLAKGFIYAGFLPRTRGKFEKLILSAKIPLFAFESPYRIRKSLELIAELSPTAQLCLGRELTKFYEQILRGTASEISAIDFPEKGEFSLVLKPGKDIAK